jgi:transposase
MLDLEPAVSSKEIESEINCGPLPDSTEDNKLRRNRKHHPGRNELPAHLERVEEIIARTPEQCKCGQCGGETRVIGYEETEVLGKKPAVHFVRVIKREKRACACAMHGVETAALPERIAPKSIFSDEVIIDFVVSKYRDAIPLYRQRAMLLRHLCIEVALTTTNDAVLRVGQSLIPVVDRMKRDLLAGDYIQADETYVGVQTKSRRARTTKPISGSTVPQEKAWSSTSR